MDRKYNQHYFQSRFKQTFTLKLTHCQTDTLKNSLLTAADPAAAVKTVVQPRRINHSIFASGVLHISPSSSMSHHAAQKFGSGGPGGEGLPWS